MASKAKAKAAPSALSDRYCAYLGPTLLGTIYYGTVYKGTKETVVAKLASVIEQYPLVAEMIVDDTVLPAARVAVKTPGTLLNNYYRKMLRAYKQGGKIE